MSWFLDFIFSPFEVAIGVAKKEGVAKRKRRQEKASPKEKASPRDNIAKRRRRPSVGVT